MSQDFDIFVVDDAPTTRHVLDATLGKHYNVESFETAEDCLMRLQETTPALFLLDVGLPGMDGYAFCRALRERPATADVPVIFISSLDDLESRLKGYDAGGQDFVVKPYKVAELKEKIEVFRRTAQTKRQLRQSAADSEALTSQVLSNLDEYAVLIKFLRTLNVCGNLVDVPPAVHEMLRAFGLTGAVQIRTGADTITLGADGASHPLEASVIEQIRGDGRVVSFRDRSAYNFDRLTVLVNNMPLTDSERCGRLRDHLAIAAECADARLQMLLASTRNTHTQGELTSLSAQLDSLLAGFHRRYEAAQAHATMLAHALPFDVTAMVGPLGLNEDQEQQIQRFIEAKAQEMIATVSISAELGATLRDFEKRLRALLA